MKNVGQTIISERWINFKGKGNVIQSNYAPVFVENIIDVKLKSKEEQKCLIVDFF